MSTEHEGERLNVEELSPERREKLSRAAHQLGISLQEMIADLPLVAAELIQVSEEELDAILDEGDAMIRGFKELDRKRLKRG